MKYDTAEAFRAALDQRIRNEAATSGVPVMRLRKRVAFERFLARLAVDEQPTAPSERLPIPSLLDFADIQPIEMPVIALEQHIAEKVHAYTAARRLLAIRGAVSGLVGGPTVGVLSGSAIYVLA